MNSDDDKSWESAINEAPKRGPFPFLTPPGKDVERRVWNCPFCDHELRYTFPSKDAAELAANSHMSRQHKRESMFVVLPDWSVRAASPVTGRESSLPGGDDSRQPR